MIYTAGTIAINGNTVKGTGTNFSEPLSLIRVGCTLIAIGNPVQIFAITEIKSGTELSVTPAANPAIPAGTKFSILLSDSISVDGLAQDVAETLRYYQGKETEVARALEWSQDHIADKIGLGDNYRDCPDISGDPANYVGFVRILESAAGFPSVASSEWCLTGWIAHTHDDGNGLKEYSGVFVGHNTKSVYSYTYHKTSGAIWTRHARGDELSRIPTIGGGELITITAPSGVEDGKYYPIIVNASYYGAHETGYQIDIHTKTGSASDPMNCNAFTGYVRTGGWSDRKDSGYGYYTTYDADEVALQSICAPGRDNDHLLFVFVEARAFPVTMRLPVGVTAEAPATQVIYNEGRDSEMIIPWGVSDPLSSHKNLIVMFDFRLGRCGFYSATAEGLYYICNGGSVGLFNGITVGEEISMTTPKLTINGVIGSSNGYVTHNDADWGAQQSDSVNKFKPIAGKTNAPESNETYGGVHIGFSGNHATQFAGRNSKFYARSFEAGVDGGWRQLATTNTPNQQWTAHQNLTKTSFNSSDFSRSLEIKVENTTKTNSHLWLWGNETQSSVLEYSLTEPYTNTSLGYAFFCQLDPDRTIKFQVNGIVNCTTLNQSSDRDLKDNIKVISNATEAIRKMNGYTYTLKENGLPYAGVIAQEAMGAIPEAVGSFTYYGEALQGPTIDGNELREETRYLNVDYAAVTGLLVQVARETDNRVTELEEENASLRANIAVMDERITKLEALVRQLTGSEE